MNDSNSTLGASAKNIPSTEDIRHWANELGFADAAIAPMDLDEDARHLRKWLDTERHGSMSYMARNQDKRTNPAALVNGTLSVVSLRMDYSIENPESAFARLKNDGKAYISRYALGRDYHKLMRKRLQKLANRIEQKAGPFGYRAFVDSAPVLEKALARNAGLGWIGKHTLVLNRDAGSLFFLGELFTDLPLAADKAETTSHCGSCNACMDICPTKAIVAPYQLDARRCISYLTIENQGPIPIEFRQALGNRIFGCDDCQLVCPWNRYASLTTETDFAPRHNLDNSELVELFRWSESEFLQRTEGMPLRRAGYNGWLRNIAIALGNGPATSQAVEALNQRLPTGSQMLDEHLRWALQQLQNRLPGS